MTTRFSSMTPADFRYALAEAGLTQNAAGDFFGVDDRLPRRWATGKMRVPIVVSALLYLMIEYGISPDEIRQIDD